MIRVWLGGASLAPFYEAVLGLTPDDGPDGWRVGLPGAGGNVLPSGPKVVRLGDDGSDGLPVRWVELQSGDPDADLAWLQTEAGIASDELPAPGEPYHLLRTQDQVIGGCTAASGTIAWVPWIDVDDVDRAVRAVKEHGGTLLGEPVTLSGVGTMVAARDPSGGCFGILRPTEET